MTIMTNPQRFAGFVLSATNDGTPYMVKLLTPSKEVNMVALFAFAAGLYFKLPIGYFIIGFLCLLLDGAA